MTLSSPSWCEGGEEDTPSEPEDGVEAITESVMLLRDGHT